MQVWIENLQNKINITDKIHGIIELVVKLCLEEENLSIPSEINVLLMDNEEIRKINLEYRQMDKPTDVLSFPLVSMKEGTILSDEGDFDYDEGRLLLGDILISLEKVVEQASEYEHSFERELAFLVTHGVFHLLGYDHESEDDEKKMFSKQELILKKMNLRRE